MASNVYRPVRSSQTSFATAVQPDGKIVEVGFSDQQFAGNGSHPSFVVIRLATSDGTLDTYLRHGRRGRPVNPNSVANSFQRQSAHLDHLGRARALTDDQIVVAGASAADTSGRAVLFG